MSPIFGSERILGRPPKYLFNRAEPGTKIDQLRIAGQNARKVWLRFIIGSDRNTHALLESFIHRTSSVTTYLFEAVYFAGRMDEADRSLNGFINNLALDNRSRRQEGRFGELLKKAYNNPILADHNYEHFRRFEKWIEAVLLNDSIFRHDRSVYTWVHSLFHAGKMHDIDQVLSLQRNLQHRREGKKELKVKKGHAIAGSIMGLATHKRYAEESMMRIRDAWDVAAGSAYMGMRHDEPENLASFLAADKPAWRVENGELILLHGTELLRMFENDQIDGSTISPSQMTEILILQKAKAGFIEGFDQQVFMMSDQEVDTELKKFLNVAKTKLSSLSINPHYSGSESILGLAPEFEYEYAEELLELMANERPLLERIIDETTSLDDKETLKLATQLMYKADLMDMIAPPVEAIHRMLQVQYSLGRDFWPNKHTIEELKKRVNLTRVQKGMPVVEDDIETLLIAVVELSGNMDQEADSDVRRWLWMLEHVDFTNSTNGSVFDIDASQYMRSINKDNAIMGLLYFREIGEKTMRGDLSHIDESYGNRKRRLAVKALKKSGMSNRAARRFLTASVNIDEAVIDNLSKRGFEGLANNYRTKTAVMTSECERLRLLISKNQEKNGLPYPRVYEESEILMFTELCDQYLIRLCTKYNITPREVSKYRKLMRSRKYTSATPFYTYDSIARPENARTLLS